MGGILTIEAFVEGVGGVAVRGRIAWALLRLVATGKTGCSYIDHAAPRWSSYVHELRKLGIIIETVREPHGGRFAGHHARYVLCSNVRILEQRGRNS